MESFFEAFQAGKRIADPTTWKNRQVTVADLSVIIGALLMFLRLVGVNIDIPAADVLTIAGFGAIVLGGVNRVLTIITTKRLGSQP